MAMSRNPVRVVISTLLKRALSSVSSKKLTSLVSIFPSSIFSGDRLGMSRFARYLRKLLMTMR